MSRKPLLLTAMVALLAVPAFSSAQDQPRPRGNNQGQQDPAGGQGGGAGGGRRGNFDPAQMREQMMTRLKEQLGSNDEEWGILAPKVEKVMTAQRDARVGGFGGRRGGGPGGGGTGGGGAPAGGGEADQSPVALASRELRETLDKKDSSADQINGKLTALRDARAKARENLVAAQKDLKELLTARQEAVLVSTGMLE